MDMQSDARQLLEFHEGSDLFVRDRASPSSAEINVTPARSPGVWATSAMSSLVRRHQVRLRDARTPDRGRRRGGSADLEHLEYDVPGRALRRVIPSDIIAEEGHDIAPHYLPDGRIVFASTRQRQARAILLDEGKPQFAAQDEDRREPAFVLHVMDADGSDIHQVSFNQSHDLEPAVLDDGRIVFSRWDHAGPQSEIHLYAMRPDGSDLELLYGAQSHMTGTDGSEVQFLDPRPMANARCCTRLNRSARRTSRAAAYNRYTVNYVETRRRTCEQRRALRAPRRSSRRRIRS
jgi:hypothetical protein